MTCRNCGCNVAEGVTYCTNCGAKMPAQQPAYDAYEDTGILENQTVQTNPAPVPPAYKPPRPSTHEVPQAPAGQPSKGMGIAGMILGISSFALSLFSCLYYLAPFTLATGIVGLILSSKAANSAKACGVTDSRAKLGRTFSIIGIILVGLLVLAVIAFYVIYLVFGISLFSFAALTDSYYY